MENKYQFRRQFILSSNPQFGFKSWTNLKLDKNLHLSVHPDLEVAQSSFGTIQLTLLGFVVNPFEPLKLNQEILDDLVKDAKNFNDVLLKTDHLGGRWVIIYKDNLSLKMFHDPCGQRQVFYHSNLGKEILCGSDPAIMNHFVTLEKDTDEGIKEFINSAVFEKKENAWIGSGTIYKGVEHLMPNYYLNLNDMKAVRFWPSKPIGHLDLEKGAELAAEMLKGSLLAISNRHKLTLAVTAGWDSRILLAASKDVKDNTTYFISLTGDEGENYHDLVVPKRLFKKLGMPFYAQKCDVELEPEFKKNLESNVSMARVNLHKAKFIYKYHLDFDGRVSVNGNVSEIARTYLRQLFPVKTTGENIARLGCFQYGGLSYVTTQFDKWIEDINELCEKNNLNIYDMLYWEQRLGNWGARYPSEQDISIEQFTPFNNRLLLTTLLSVEEKYRKDPNFVLHYKIIEKLWPETLVEPIGKTGLRNTVKLKIKRVISVFVNLFLFQNK
jgi:hypothetical protein